MQAVRLVACGDSLLYPAAVRTLAGRHTRRRETPDPAWV